MNSEIIRWFKLSREPKDSNEFVFTFTCKYCEWEFNTISVTEDYLINKFYQYHTDIKLGLHLMECPKHLHHSR